MEGWRDWKLSRVLAFLRTCHCSKRQRCSQPSPGTTKNCRTMVLASVGEPALLDQVCKDFSLKTVKANEKIRAAKPENTEQQKTNEKVAVQA